MAKHGRNLRHGARGLGSVPSCLSSFPLCSPGGAPGVDTTPPVYMLHLGCVSVTCGDTRVPVCVHCALLQQPRSSPRSDDDEDDEEHQRRAGSTLVDRATAPEHPSQSQGSESPAATWKPLIDSKKAISQSGHHSCSSRTSCSACPKLNPTTAHLRVFPVLIHRIFWIQKSRQRCGIKGQAPGRLHRSWSYSNKKRNQNCSGGCGKIGKVPEKPQRVTRRCDVLLCDMYGVPGRFSSLHPGRFSSPEWTKWGLAS